MDYADERIASRFNDYGNTAKVKVLLRRCTMMLLSVPVAVVLSSICLNYFGI
jgi:hypothetical protein